MKLDHLFSPGKIGNVTIKNRFVRSATAEKMATIEGFASEKLIKLFSDLAAGEAGLIITGGLAVTPSSTLTTNAPCIYEDKFIKEQKNLVDIVHENLDSKICAQIVHTGAQTGNKKFQPVAPSPIKPDNYNRIPRELTIEEIESVIIKSFVDAGRRVYEAGYDMIQIHGSHNYLLSSFISPFFNRRTDKYGGNTQNRTRILVEIYEQLSDVVDIPIIIKQQIKDFILGGLDFEEGKEITRILVKTGYDAVELSGGGAMVAPEGKGYPSIILKSKSDENYFLKQCDEIKSEMKGVPLICVGGIRDPFFAEEIIRENRVDFISMCRPFIREPDLIKRWHSGDTSRPKCISCNDCFPTIFKKSASGLHCAVEERKTLKKSKSSN